MGTIPSPFAESSVASGGPSPPMPRLLRVAIGAAIALLLVYVVWQGYRNPDFLLGLATFRLC